MIWKNSKAEVAIRPRILKPYYLELHEFPSSSREKTAKLPIFIFLYVGICDQFSFEEKTPLKNTQTHTLKTTDINLYSING